MIKYVLFDLDGTILDFIEGEKDSFVNTLKELYKYNPNKKDIKLFSKINEECFLEYQNNKVSRKEPDISTCQALFVIVSNDYYRWSGICLMYFFPFWI